MLEPGFELGHYRIIRSLGSGGMADVYEAEDVRIGRRLALKVLPPELTRTGELIERFEKEIRAAAALSHPCIVTLFEFGHEPPYHYYTMQLLPGGDLRERMRQPMALTDVMKTVRGVAEAFNHAHKRGFVHRDVKPENILFDEEGTPVLTDFGIAKAIDSQTRMTKTGMSVGTPRYISPEQIRGKEVDGRADLYALGCILYEMLSGEPPYDAPDTMAIVFKHVSEPIPILPPQYHQLQGLLESLMAKDPEQRCPDAKTLMQQIDALFPRDWTGQIHGVGTGVTPAPVAPPDPGATRTAQERAAAAAPTLEVENLKATGSGPGPESITAELETPLPGAGHPTQATPRPDTPPPRPPEPPDPAAGGKPARRTGPWLAAAAVAGAGVAALAWLQFGAPTAEVAGEPVVQASPAPAASPAQARVMDARAGEPGPTTPPAQDDTAASLALAQSPSATSAPDRTASATPARRAQATPTPRPTAAPAQQAKAAPPQPTTAPIQQAKVAPPQPRVTPVPESVLRARREASAQRLFEDAQKQQRQEGDQEAKPLYERIVKDYRDTRAAESARKTLAAIEAREERARRDALAALRRQQRQSSAQQLIEAGEALESRDELTGARDKYAEVVSDYGDLQQLANTARERIQAIDAALARAQTKPTPSPTKAPPMLPQF